MIDFELEPQILSRLQMFHAVSEHMMRPISRECDENEHTQADEVLRIDVAGVGRRRHPGRQRPQQEGRRRRCVRTAPRNLMTVLSTEELCWGDAGLYLSTPNSGTGRRGGHGGGHARAEGALPQALQGRQAQVGRDGDHRAGMRFRLAAVTTTATRDGDHWVINGTKIFCTAGQMAAEKSEGFVVVWATVDKSAGRAGIKPFVVEHNTPGMTVARVENKLGIRASDTAAIVFDNCRVPLDHLLGSAEVRKEGGFKDVMATFDATRPIVAAMAIGVGRAALDFVRDFLKDQKVPIRYGISPRRLTAVERDFMEMEVQLKAARLLTWRAAWMLDTGKRNSLEASMAKAKAGLAVTLITQKAVELLGPLGYSRKVLVEKWMRDAKINDIFEGTQQINMMIIARRILDYSSKELN